MTRDCWIDAWLIFLAKKSGCEEKERKINLLLTQENMNPMPSKSWANKHQKSETGPNFRFPIDKLWALKTCMKKTLLYHIATRSVRCDLIKTSREQIRKEKRNEQIDFWKVNSRGFGPTASGAGFYTVSSFHFILITPITNQCWVYTCYLDGVFEILLLYNNWIIWRQYSQNLKPKVKNMECSR